jgi:Protein of unknown function (DUF3047)
MIKATLIAVFCAVACAFPGQPDTSLAFTFAKDASEKKLPFEWKVMKGKGTEYSVVKEDSMVVLHAVSHEGNTLIGRKIQLSLPDYPVMSWKWKAVQLPDNGKETEKHKNDSGCGIYVLLKTGLFFKAVKYVWSTTLPAGTVLESRHNSNVKILVLESGKDRVGQWISERVNIRDDIKRCFGDKWTEIRGIGIMTDADNTHSSAEAWYADIRLGAGDAK